MSVFDSLSAAVASAQHIDANGKDAAVVAAAYALARKIDAWDIIVAWAHEDAVADGSRPKVPQNDNTTLPTFLKYCEALGLTPAARKAVGPDTAPPPADALSALKARRGKRPASGA